MKKRIVGKLKWTVERRMAFIDFRLQWDGRINRNDVATKFDISLNQATNDLVRYGKVAPGNMRYDLSLRTYVRGAKFCPQYDTTGISGYLDQLQAIAEGVPKEGDAWIGNVPPFEILAVPTGEVGVDTLRSVIGAIQAAEPLDVLQQTNSEVEPVWCTMLPQALLHDGDRWCVRAYSALSKSFETIALSRLSDFRAATAPPAPAIEDTDWNARESIRLAPNPTLPGADREGVMRDYGMIDGELTIKVRRALVSSLLRKLGVVGAGSGASTLVVLDRHENAAESRS